MCTISFGFVVERKNMLWLHAWGRFSDSHSSTSELEIYFVQSNLNYTFHDVTTFKPVAEVCRIYLSNEIAAYII